MNAPPVLVDAASRRLMGHSTTASSASVNHTPSRRNSEAAVASARRDRPKKMKRNALIALALESESDEDAKAKLIDYVTTTSTADLRRFLQIPTASHVRGLQADLARNLVRILSRGSFHLHPEFQKRVKQDKQMRLRLLSARGDLVVVKGRRDDLHQTLIECLELA